MEINVADGYRVPADVDDMMAMMKETITKAGKPVIIFADWRRCDLFSDAVAERVTWMLTRDNPMVERSAILHGDTHGMFLLQVGRLIREGGHKNRRTFSEPKDAFKYLIEKLTAPERDRLELLLRDL
jgi:hypothetical protein